MHWATKFRNNFEMHGHAIQRCIFSKQTQYQLVEVVDTFNYGRVLILDGIPQSSSTDEFIYHEAIVHPILCAHPAPKEILIVGGGEGATLREVLKHTTVQQVTMVDIDRELVDICREYLSDWHRGAFDNPKVHVLYEDGRAYLQTSPGRFDCIILDLSDPFDGSPATQLFTLEFYKLARLALRERGLLVLQTECGALHHSDEHCRIIHTLKQVFPSVLPYYLHIPLYATLYAFAICGGLTLTLEQLTSPQIDLILASSGVHDLRFYDSETARGLFSIPKYIRQSLKNTGKQTITDSNLLRMHL